MILLQRFKIIYILLLDLLRKILFQWMDVGSVQPLLKADPKRVPYDWHCRLAVFIWVGLPAYLACLPAVWSRHRPPAPPGVSIHGNISLYY